MEADGHTLMRLAFAAMAAHALGAGCRLGVPEALGEEARPLAEIARATGLPSATLRRLLRAMSGLGVAVESAPDSFAATPATVLLRRDHPAAVGEFVRTFTDPQMLAGWLRLEDSLRTGEPSFDQVFGEAFFERLAHEPELSSAFNAAMRAGTRGVAAGVAQALDLSRFATLVDVGGGDGTLLAALLGANPGLHGVLLDSAEGSAQAPQVLDAAGVVDRCRVETGDFFAAVPDGGDAYVLKSIVHDWDDETCAGILIRCAQALSGTHGRVFVVEPVLPPTSGPEALGGYLSDLNMLVNVGGRERTRADFEALAERSGLTLATVVDLPGGYRVLELAPR